MEDTVHVLVNKAILSLKKFQCNFHDMNKALDDTTKEFNRVQEYIREIESYIPERKIDGEEK